MYDFQLVDDLDTDVEDNQESKPSEDAKAVKVETDADADARTRKRVMGACSRYLQKTVTKGSSMSVPDPMSALCRSLSFTGPETGVLKRKYSSFLLVPLEERFKTWFREVLMPAEVHTSPGKTQSLIKLNPLYMHRFDDFKSLCTPKDTVEDVLEVLKKYAWLVQGIWVPKNSVIYGEAWSLVSDAREYALMLFSKSHSIKSSDIRNAPKCLNAECLHAVLKTLATERKLLDDWKFKEPADVLFINQFPDIVREQESFWEETEKQWARRITLDESGISGLAAGKLLDDWKPADVAFINLSPDIVREQEKRREEMIREDNKRWEEIIREHEKLDAESDEQLKKKYLQMCV